MDFLLYAPLNKTINRYVMTNIHRDHKIFYRELLTLQESLLACPAHNICSTIPPGAAGPYFKRQSVLLQIGILTSCKTAG